MSDLGLISTYIYIHLYNVTHYFREGSYETCWPGFGLPFSASPTSKKCYPSKKNQKKNHQNKQQKNNSTLTAPAGLIVRAGNWNNVRRYKSWFCITTPVLTCIFGAKRKFWLTLVSSSLRPRSLLTPRHKRKPRWFPLIRQSASLKVLG